MRGRGRYAGRYVKVFGRPIALVDLNRASERPARSVADTPVYHGINSAAA
jgi:hypothetical protein